MNRTATRLVIVISLVCAAAGLFFWGLRNHTVIAQDRPWYVWMKTAPCSGRTDWVSVAQDNPSVGGGPSFEYFPGSHSWPTFAAAMAEADTLRQSPTFASYCCRENSVWRNVNTGKLSVVTSKYGNAGPGWQLVKGDMCCDEAFAYAGIPGSCGSTGNAGSTPASCFSSDPGMASTNRDDHVRWAQNHGWTEIEENMDAKVALLFSCPGISDDQLQNAFADYSATIAKYVQQQSCFGSDTGATNPDRSAHLAWARTKSRKELLDNLNWKMNSAFECLGPIGSVNLFADNSMITANSPGPATTPSRPTQPTQPIQPLQQPPVTNTEPVSGLPVTWAGTYGNEGPGSITISGGAGGITATEIWSGGGRNGRNTWTNCKVNGNTATCDWTGTYEGDPGKKGNRHGTMTVTISGDSLTGTYYEQKPDFVNADGTPFTGWSAMHEGATWPINFRRR